MKAGHPVSAVWRLAAVAAALALAACSSEPKRPQPADLGPNVVQQGARMAWSVRTSPLGSGTQVSVSGSTAVVASTDGTVVAVDASNGRELWRATAGGPLASGAGTDGTLSAAVTRGAELVAWQAGREVWRRRLAAESYTAPLIAGGRVFALGADRSVTALDARTGNVLWTQQRTGEPLVLGQAGTLLAVGNTLVAGLSARLTGLNPDTGTIVWEAPLASPRGINDIERLVDLTAPFSRVGDSVCVRAYQATVGCVNAARGQVVWTRPANGAAGVTGDEQSVFGAEADGTVVAWRRADGERLWSTDRLRWRELSGPLALGRSVVVGDNTGLVHLLSRENGAPLNRLATDGSAVVGSPVVAGNTLIVVTRNGGIFGFVPE